MCPQALGHCLVLVAAVVCQGAAEIALAGNESCESSLVQTSRVSRGISTACQNWCGGGSSSPNMCINSVGDGLSLDQKVHNIKGNWAAGCNHCGQDLQGQNKLCYGWYCGEAGTGIWLKRDGQSCPAWEGSCANTRDNDNSLNSCAKEIAYGTKCSDWLVRKECDKQCNLCPCSTGSGSTPQHCSGHGTCIAQCSEETCLDAYCVCDEQWTGSKCSAAKTTTTTTPPPVTCNDKVMRSCSECSQADCRGEDCFWKDDDAGCVPRVDCGFSLAPSCSECGSQYECHGECYWSTQANACLDPLDPSLEKSCGPKHRANTCAECLTIFRQIDKAWANHHAAGCRGDCVYNPYFDSCQDVDATRPANLHPACPADLTECATQTQESSGGSDAEKMVSSVYQLSYGVLTFGANWLSAFGEDRFGKKTVKTRVFQVKTLGQLATIAGIIYGALTPKPVQPCSDTYSEDDYFLCIWDGIMPYVEQFVDDKLDDVETSNYQARVFSVLARLRELKAFIQNSLNVSDLEGMTVSEELANSPRVNATRNQTLAILVNLDSYMRNTGGFFLKDNAPFSQVVYLNFWAQLHTFVMFAMLSVDPDTYQTEPHIFQFASSMADYAREIEQRGLNAHVERLEMVVLDKTACPSQETECTTPRDCPDCYTSAVLRDKWAKCNFESGTMNIGKCVDPSIGCWTTLRKEGTCGEGLTHDECMARASSCASAYQNGVMFEADVGWFDYAVAHVPALRNSALRLSGSWAGRYLIANTVCGGVDVSWALETEKAAAICCEKECKTEASSMCPEACSSNTMSFAEAASFCEDKGKQLCSAYELNQQKCCGKCSQQRIWTRSTSTRVYASQEPCLEGE